MEIIKLDPSKAKREAKELEKKYAEEQTRKKKWQQFKDSYYWGLMMEELDKQIAEYEKITNVKVGTISPKDFADLGHITAVRLEIYEGIKKIKQAFISK